ncbi:MAG: hypothetical protein RLZZ26_402 [Candidatus Parcubacteria bacterium]|jgi:FtsH-binding integral membrane protein
MTVLNDYLGRIVDQIVNPLILLLGAAAFVLFIWGVFEFILHADDEGKREEGRKAIMWGLIGLVIIFGAYGIINLALGTFGLKPYDTSTGNYTPNVTPLQ